MQLERLTNRIQEMIELSSDEEDHLAEDESELVEAAKRRARIQDREERRARAEAEERQRVPREVNLEGQRLGQQSQSQRQGEGQQERQSHASSPNREQQSHRSSVFPPSANPEDQERFIDDLVINAGANPGQLRQVMEQMMRRLSRRQEQDNRSAAQRQADRIVVHSVTGEIANALRFGGPTANNPKAFKSGPHWFVTYDEMKADALKLALCKNFAVPTTTRCTCTSLHCNDQFDTRIDQWLHQERGCIEDIKTNTNKTQTWCGTTCTS